MLPSPRICAICGAANQPHATFCSRCGQSLQDSTKESTVSVVTSLLIPNQLLKQRYAIISRVGQGGMGTVYKAKDTALNRYVAVKEMSQRGLSQHEISEFTNAFNREAHILATLRHPNLPIIHDYFGEVGHWYFVMEFIEGETLEAYLNKAKDGHLVVEEVIQIGIQLCTVLSYLHNSQPPIIFRDLKPANVMRTPDGHLYLIDFGIARHFKPEQTKDTSNFISLGYAAPEQYGNAQTTVRSDIYSLGSTLHHLISGKKPSLNKPTLFDFPPLQSSGQPIPPGLESLIMQMLAKDQSKRPASMAIVKQELQQVATQPLVKPPGISRRTIVVGLAGFFAAASIGITWLTTAHRAHSPTSKPTPSPISYPLLAHRYKGHVDNTTNAQLNISRDMSLSIITQFRGNIKGDFGVEGILGSTFPLCGSGPFIGTIDTQGTINFTVQPNDGCSSGPLDFHGSQQKDGTLSGNYRIPKTGESGIWSVSPS